MSNPPQRGGQLMKTLNICSSQYNKR